MRRRRAGVTRAGVVIALAILLTTGGFLAAALGNAQGKANRSKCHNQVRQLGLAAIQHADDRRFFPHVGDGGLETNHTTRALRSVVDAGYLDGGYVFVCPESNDEAVEPAMSGPGRAWTWGTLRDRPEVDPRSPDAADPTLAETTELSYGWTRRRLNANTRSMTPLSADRAVRERDADPTDDPLQGNHVGGLSLLQADGTVMWLSDVDPARERLTAMDDAPGAGALAVAPLDRPRPRARGWWERAGLEGLALLPLGVGGLLLLLRGEPAAPPRARRAGRVVRVDRVRVETVGAEVELQAAQRCPFCHDGVVDEGDVAALTRCSGCSAVFHAECVAPGCACTTLGCPGAAS
jgi:hypothetical protein